MIAANKKLLTLYIFIIFSLLITGYFSYSNSEELSSLKKKTALNAKEIESLKLDIADLKQKVTLSRNNGFVKNNEMDFLKNSLTGMKNEVSRLRTAQKTEELAEYKKREENIWDTHAENTKKYWSGELLSKLKEQQFAENEIDEVLYNYNLMLDSMKDSLMKWYRDEITDDEISTFSKETSKQFYENNSSSIGEQKASIVLGIVFPDPFFRKDLFENTKTD
jgi:hypothetical protein